MGDVESINVLSNNRMIRSIRIFTASLEGIYWLYI